MDKIGLTPEKVAESIDKWLTCGRKLCQLFQLNELFLTVPQKARIYHYYVPVFLWCEDQIAEHQSAFKEGEDIPPLVVYIFGFRYSFLMFSVCIIVIYRVNRGCSAYMK